MLNGLGGPCPRISRVANLLHFLMAEQSVNRHQLGIEASSMRKTRRARCAGRGLPPAGRQKDHRTRTPRRHLFAGDAKRLRARARSARHSILEAVFAETAMLEFLYQ
jgi:hypothetical protein